MARPARARRRDEGGTGVGLANVRERLTARYGAMAGVPARPRSRRRLYRPSLYAGGARMSAPLRAMIVDDEPLAVERLQLLLARLAGRDRRRHRQ